ncbi:nicotinic acid mononucleotide adenyltransferase [Flavobacteriaceae bacterium D16]|nr:nicotinic acid mononucleotide adenyltransferase [Flavobacteriaceae bacterium D16]
MKIVTTLIVFLFVSLIYAQEVKPIFEQQGDMVKAIYFHDNGVVAQTGFYEDGKPEGEWKMYNNEGKKIALGQFTSGKKTGKWFFWEGEGLREVDYTDNKIANVIKWTDSESVVLNK